jgi:hypothetical protein
MPGKLLPVYNGVFMNTANASCVCVSVDVYMCVGICVCMCVYKCEHVFGWLSECKCVCLCG